MDRNVAVLIVAIVYHLPALLFQMNRLPIRSIPIILIMINKLAVIILRFHYFLYPFLSLLKFFTILVYSTSFNVFRSPFKLINTSCICYINILSLRINQWLTS